MTKNDEKMTKIMTFQERTWKKDTKMSSKNVGIWDKSGKMTKKGGQKRVIFGGYFWVLSWFKRQKWQKCQKSEKKCKKGSKNVIFGGYISEMVIFRKMGKQVKYASPFGGEGQKTSFLDEKMTKKRQKMTKKGVIFWVEKNVFKKVKKKFPP